MMESPGPKKCLGYLVWAGGSRAAGMVGSQDWNLPAEELCRQSSIDAAGMEAPVKPVRVGQIY